jgi:hypothetical protein
VRFVTDVPIGSKADDALGTAPFVDVMYGAVRRAETPFVFGLLGGWGTGKTSILSLLQARAQADAQSGLRGPDDLHLVPIWFNAWKYENDSDIVYPLLYHIRREHDALVGNDPAFAASFGKVVAASAMSAIDLGLRVITKHATGEALTLEDVAKRLTEIEKKPDTIDTLLRAWVDKVSELSGAFQNLVDRYAEDYARLRNVNADRVRFVILVDDLDRCMPDIAINLLEKLKNFLAVRRCIYVLALNPEVIHQGIRVKFQGAHVDGRQYLEKILNYSFHVPVPATDSLRAFATAQLRLLVDDQAERERLEPFIEQFGKVTSDCQFENPRKLKRILNRYLVFLAMYQADLPRYYVGNVVRLIILAEYYPDLFQLYVSSPEAHNDLRHFGVANFSVDRMEQKYGVRLAEQYGELARMKALFHLQKPLPASEEFDLERHATSVYAITRLR